MTQYNQTPQYEKNPNGGYLNPSKFGGHYGKLELTPELIAQAQAKGAIEIKITEEKMNQKGEPYIRITAKPYDDSWKTNASVPQAPAPTQGVPVQQGLHTPQGQFVQPQAPAPQAPAPVAQHASEEIPF